MIPMTTFHVTIHTPRWPIDCNQCDQIERIFELKQNFKRSFWLCIDCFYSIWQNFIPVLPKNGKMQILITLYGHMFKNNPAIWLHWQQPISTYYLHTNVITFPSIHLTSKITQTLCDKELEDICWNLVLRSSVKLGMFMLKYNWWLIDSDQSVHTTYIPA